jgi:5-methylcytosine-specific restriction protein A
MPPAPKRVCTFPGCTTLTLTGRCEKHRDVGTGSFADASRGTRQERGYGNRWDKLRIQVLERDQYLCQVCLKLGFTSAAEQVDHIVPKAHGGDDAPENLQAICRHCHRIKTAFESGGRSGSSMPDWLPPPLIKVRVVCGPPGSGKTEYVRAHAGAGDLVLDLPALAAELTGKPLFDATREELARALYVRNSLLGALGKPGMKWERAWLVVTAGTPRERDFWAERYGPVTVMPVNKQACIQRIRLDPERPLHAKEMAIRAVEEWS